MTRATWAFFACLAIVALMPMAAAADPAPFAATLDYESGIAMGTLDILGGVRALHFPIDPDLPLPQAAIVQLDAKSLTVQEDFRDHVGNPQTAYVVTDQKMNSRSETLTDATLRLDAIREQVQLMVIARDDAAAPKTRIAAPEAKLTGAERLHEEFFPSVAGAPRHEWQRELTVEAPTLSLEMGAASESILFEGDFTVYLWDVDLADAKQPDRKYRSGEFHSNIHGKTDLTPDGAVTEKRKQLLTLEVRDGRLTVALPGRPLTLHAEPATTRVLADGSWDLVGATGFVTLAGATNEVRSSDLHLSGTFALRFEADGFPVTSHWEGFAEDASAAQAALVRGAPAATVARDLNFSPLLVGLVLAGMGGATAAGVYGLRHRPRPSEATAAVAAPEEAVPGPGEAEDALVTGAIALMEQGRAHEVIDALEPGFSAEAATAPVSAYLLSLAHIREGDHEAGVRWILRAVEVFPDFAAELRANAAFAPIRGDPRIQRILDREGVAGYV